MLRQLFRRLFGSSPASKSTPAPAPRRAPPSGAPSPGGQHHLALYKFDSCPYCRRVQRTIDSLGLNIERRDILKDPSMQKELVAKTGRRQVPCLFIDGEPLFESEDIIAWLEAHASAG
jgi:glutaredoxin 3